MRHKVKPDIYGTLTHWQCGFNAGRIDARAAEPGDTCLEARDFTPDTPADYILGYIAGWQDSPFTVKEITFSSSGPGAPVYVRGHNSKAALNRAIRANHLLGA